MKKSLLVLILAVMVLTTGCKKEETPVQQETTVEDVFVESDVEEPVEEQPTDTNEVDAYMDTVKEQSDAIKNSLEKDSLTQTDMNLKSQELYELWDGALNYLWGELKANLSEEDFENLLTEQRSWISEKEAAVEEAGKEFEGGSIYALVVNSEAAAITEERVFELYELLKK